MNDGDAVTATASPANGPITFGSTGAEMPTDAQCRCPQCSKVSVQAASGPNQWRRYCPVCDGHFRAGDTVLVPRKKTLGSIAAEFPSTIPALQEAAGHRDPAEVQPAPAVTVTLMEGIFDPTQKVSLSDFASPGPGTGAVDPCSTKPIPLLCTFSECNETATFFGTGGVAGEYRCRKHREDMAPAWQALMQPITDDFLRRLGAEVDATFETEEEPERAKNADAGSAVQAVHPADATVKRLETQLAMSQKGRRVAEEELTQARAKLAAIDKVLFHSPLSYEPDRAEAIGKIMGEIDRRDMATVAPIRVRHEARAERLGLAQNIFTTVIMLHPLDDPEANATRAVQYADLLLSALAKKGGE